MPVRTVTLTANTPTQITASAEYDYVAVFHTGNTSEVVHVTVNDVDPVADADDVYRIPSGVRRRIPFTSQTGNSRVRLLSTGAVRVEVEF